MKSLKPEYRKPDQPRISKWCSARNATSQEAGRSRSDFGLRTRFGSRNLACQQFLFLPRTLCHPPFPFICPAIAQPSAAHGRLYDYGEHASGNYDQKSVYFDVPRFGFAIGRVLTNDNVAVDEAPGGVSLDFGAGVFDGGDLCWHSTCGRASASEIPRPVHPDSRYPHRPTRCMRCPVEGRGHRSAAVGTALNGTLC